ncbi:hypothetical protein [Paenibacillus macquariensis]|uniref:Uncharacterized protein n=1 Tax=Paenibacillus macquariensis TaxID=948756 RepID=A0ABY1K5P9_9BACL|nr:hypothetical protein [Paenibacillus macquariensis]MEC0090497.1 hypothetical protein [Paenibacillus macquariensis]OAB38498.1 hypothetical protein PMSM_01470 [Paenibacillus macquariensis subsp. macquariensis]SIR30183.1 hypothetical protein SAMN05421578_110118 [Paenibacillus macquariensis]
MNQSMIFKKVALSALLVSAVAVPTVTNAASEPKEVSPKVLSKTITTAPAVTNVLATTTTVASSWANPLDLAKTYAPTTLEDWKKTLEQYKKVVGETSNVQYSIDSIDMDKAGIKFDKAFEIANLDPAAVKIISATPAVAGDTNNMQYTIDMDKAGIKFDEAFEINISGTTALDSTMALPISEADQAFFKAQFALDDAAKSKDAAAIKEALAKLLVEYKQQIAEFTTTK